MNSLIPRAYRYSEKRIKVPVAKFHKESSNPGKGLGLEWRPSRLRSALKPRPGKKPEKEFPLQLTPSFYSLERTDTPPPFTGSQFITAADRSTSAQCSGRLLLM